MLQVTVRALLYLFHIKGTETKFRKTHLRPSRERLGEGGERKRKTIRKYNPEENKFLCYIANLNI
jgi:hypothetical protein